MASLPQTPPVNAPPNTPEEIQPEHTPYSTAELAGIFLTCMVSGNTVEFDQNFPVWVAGSHKQIRKVVGQDTWLLAHALTRHANQTVIDELASYERFRSRGLRTARVSGLIKFPNQDQLHENLRGLYGFFVEFVNGPRVKPLDFIPKAEFNSAHADLIRSKSKLLSSVTKNADHSALIKDILKLYAYSKTTGVYDLQGVYDGQHFTLIDPPALPGGPKVDHTKQLKWLLNCLNHYSSVKINLSSYW